MGNTSITVERPPAAACPQLISPASNFHRVTCELGTLASLGLLGLVGLNTPKPKIIDARIIKYKDGNAVIFISTKKHFQRPGDHPIRAGIAKRDRDWSRIASDSLLLSENVW